MNTTLLVLVLMGVIIHTQAYTFNRTSTISTFVQPLRAYVTWIPGIASSTGIEASCDTMLCAFYYFDAQQFAIYANSSGTQGVPIASHIALLPNTVVKLEITSDASKQSFNKRFGSSLFLVVRNLGINNTLVSGTKYVTINIRNWLIGIVLGMLTTWCLFCCLCCTCFVRILCRPRTKTVYEKIYYPVNYQPTVQPYNPQYYQSA